MGVSENSGTPKSSISIGVSIINHPFWGKTPYFWKHPYWDIKNQAITADFKPHDFSDLRFSSLAGRYGRCMHLFGNKQTTSPETKVSTTRNLVNQLATLLKTHKSVENMGNNIFNQRSYDIFKKNASTISSKLQTTPKIVTWGGMIHLMIWRQILGIFLREVWSFVKDVRLQPI